MVYLYSISMCNFVQLTPYFIKSPLDEDIKDLGMTWKR